MTVSARLEALLKAAESICVLTGAGVSAESGIATFRGPEGLWARFKPEELANVDAFMRNPALVWEWYTYRKTVIHQAQPNHAHHALVRMERLVRDFTLVTQNVDNLHARAGAAKVLELHGNIERSSCIECRTFTSEVILAKPGEAPTCRSCGGLLRPDVVWFGEILPQLVLQEAFRASERCELFLTVGTSGLVYPAAGLPLRAREHGAYVVEINTEPTELSHRCSETLHGKAGEILPKLLDLMSDSRKEQLSS
jgi:NAD-dependent deacetylase